MIQNPTDPPNFICYNQGGYRGKKVITGYRQYSYNTIIGTIKYGKF